MSQSSAISIISKQRIAYIATAAVLALGLAGSAWAQRDPAYAAARAAGNVGEKADGYLGIVSGSTPDLVRLVNDINIKRRAIYTERAGAAGSTVAAYAFTSACRLITQTTPGEKYEGPDGTWRTRTAAAPQLDGNCP